VQEVAETVEPPALIPPGSRSVYFVMPDNSVREPVDARVILYVGGLYLVLPSEESDDWMMGDSDADGTINCWAYYGPFETALRGL
jgi:hypothetical protein